MLPRRALALVLTKVLLALILLALPSCGAFSPSSAATSTPLGAKAEVSPTPVPATSTPPPPTATETPAPPTATVTQPPTSTPLSPTPPRTATPTLTPTSRPSATPTRAPLVPLIAYSGTDGNIWTVKPDATGKTKVTASGTTTTPFLDPRWSPDGRYLVFAPIAKPADYPHIVRTVSVYDAVLGTTRSLRLAKPVLLPYAYLSDGKRLVAASADSLDEPGFGSYNLVAVDLATGAVSRLATAGSATWSIDVARDGRSLVVAGGCCDGYADLLRVPLPTGTPKELYQVDVRVSPGPIAAAVSLDGAKLAYLLSRHDTKRLELVLAKPDGTSPRSVYRLPRAEEPTDITPRRISFSEDGLRLAIDVPKDSRTPNEVWIVNADGSSPRRLTVGSNPVWRPVSTSPG